MAIAGKPPDGMLKMTLLELRQFYDDYKYSDSIGKGAE